MMFPRIIGVTVFLSLLLLGLPLESWAPPGHLLHGAAAFGHRLGEALVIAAFLAVAVHEFVKSKLATEFAKDISPFMAAAALPSELQNDIRAASIVDLYRDALIATYEIKLLEGNPEQVEVTQEVSFDLHNVTNKNIKHDHIVMVQNRLRWILSMGFNYTFENNLSNVDDGEFRNNEFSLSVGFGVQF